MRTKQMLATLALVLVTVSIPERVRAQDPAGTWALEGTLKTTACAQGRCQSQSAFVQDFLVVDSAGSFEFGTVPDNTCPGAVPVMGPWVQKASGKVKLKGENLREWWAAVSACSGTRIRGRRFRGKLEPSLGTLVVRQPAHATIRGISVSIRVRGDFVATQIEGSPSGALTTRTDGAASRSWAGAFRLP